MILQSSEKERIAELKRLEILDTPPEPLFDRFVEISAEIFGVPVALISLVDSDRQWFKARVGLDVNETSRDVAFCDHAIRSDEVFVVADATQDERFRDNPLVTGKPGVKFYAGAPLTAAGHHLGTLCLIDFQPRARFEGSRQLACMAESVAQALVVRRAEIETSKASRLADDRRRLLELTERAGHIGTWCWEVAKGAMSWSDEAHRIHGLSLSGPSPDLDQMLSCYRPADAAALSGMINESLRSETTYQLQAKVRRADGALRDVVVTMTGSHGRDRLTARVLGTFQDVTRG